MFTASGDVQFEESPDEDNVQYIRTFPEFDDESKASDKLLHCRKNDNQLLPPVHINCGSERILFLVLKKMKALQLIVRRVMLYSLCKEI